MSSSAGVKIQSTRESPPCLLIRDSNPNRSHELGTLLEASGYVVRRAVKPSEAVAALCENGLALVVLADLDAAAEVRAAARAWGVPVLDVVESLSDLGSLADPHADADEWVCLDRVAEELPARVKRLLRRRVSPSAPPLTSSPLGDFRFFALLIHDLRTPLNVIGLSLRMIGQAVPQGDSDLQEDLRFVEENFRQIERMLAQLSDYLRLFENEGPLSVSEFSPRRLVADLLESRAVKNGLKSVPIRLQIHDSCPEEAALDQNRACTALQYAVTNAAAAAHNGTVVVNLRGEPDRWLIEVSIDSPPPPSVHSIELSPESFERLCGTAAERRGMDLAIAARVTQMFGGSARLDVHPDLGSTLVFDWPARVSES